MQTLKRFPISLFVFASSLVGFFACGQQNESLPATEHSHDPNITDTAKKAIEDNNKAMDDVNKSATVIFGNDHTENLVDNGEQLVKDIEDAIKKEERSPPKQVIQVVIDEQTQGDPRFFQGSTNGLEKSVNPYPKTPSNTNDEPGGNGGGLLNPGVTPGDDKKGEGGDGEGPTKNPTGALDGIQGGTNDQPPKAKPGQDGQDPNLSNNADPAQNQNTDQGKDSQAEANSVKGATTSPDASSDAQIPWGRMAESEDPIIDGYNYYYYYKDKCDEYRGTVDQNKADMNRFNPWNHRAYNFKPYEYQPPAFPKGSTSLYTFTRDWPTPPVCKSAGYNEAKNLSLTVDGLLDDWQGQGLVIWDRYGDTKMEHPALDIIGMYAAEDDKAWYVFLLFARTYRAAPPGSWLYLSVKGYHPSIVEDKANGYLSGIHWFRVTPSGAYSEDIVNQGLYDIASGMDGVEIAINKDAFKSLGIGTYPSIQVYPGHPCDSGWDYTPRYYFGHHLGRSCLVDLPGNKFKTILSYYEDGVERSLADYHSDLTAVAMGIIEDEIKDHGERVDTMTVHTRRQVNAGGYFNGGYFHIIYPNYNVSMGTAGHEYGHFFNSIYEHGIAWSNEGHSGILGNIAYDRYYGMNTYGVEVNRDFILGLESELGKPFDLSRWGEETATGNYYRKSNMLFRLLGPGTNMDRVHQVLRGGRDVDYKEDPLKLLALFTSTSGIPPSELFSGWLNNQPYHPDIGPPSEKSLPKDKRAGELDTDEDGIPDVMETILGLDPQNTQPAEDMTLVMDHHSGDWRRLSNFSWSSDPEQDQAGDCPANLDIVYGGAVRDATQTMFGLEFKEKVPWHKVKLRFLGRKITDVTNHQVYSYTYIEHFKNYYYYWKDGVWTKYGTDISGFRKIGDRFVEWSGAYKMMFATEDLNWNEESYFHINAYYEGVYCDTIIVKPYQLNSLAFASKTKAGFDIGGLSGSYMDLVPPNLKTSLLLGVMGLLFFGGMIYLVRDKKA